MRTARAALILLCTAALTAACTDDVDTPDDGGVGAGGPPPCAPELADAFAAWADAGFSGTVAVTAGGEPDCLAAYGLADEAAGTANTVDTVFAIGSVSKAVTAAAVYALVDDGRLALDDRAGDLVRDLRGPAADATVGQLLLHTSGLTGEHGRDHEPLTRDEAVAAIGGLELAFPPGTAYLYSNAGYTLLGVIIEETAGTDLRTFVTERVLPLRGGSVAGGYWDGEPAASGPWAIGRLEDGTTSQRGDAPGPHWALAGNGDVAMTTRDLAAWTHALFTGEVVSATSAAAIATPGFDHGDGTAEAPGWVVLDAAAFGAAPAALGARGQRRGAAGAPGPDARGLPPGAGALAVGRRPDAAHDRRPAGRRPWAGPHARPPAGRPDRDRPAGGRRRPADRRTAGRRRRAVRTGRGRVQGRRPDGHAGGGEPVDNAVRHAPTGSVVAVEVTVAGDDALVTVTDHGPGVPADRQERIFERFWRGPAQGPGAGPGDGTGLGLPIARQIAVAHGGGLTVRSPGPDGDGARFELRLRR